MGCLRMLLGGITATALLFQTVLVETAFADRDRPLVQSPYDPDAKTVGLFTGLEEGVITAQVTPRGAEGGNLFLANQTKEPLTVQMPAGFVGIPVKPQFGPFGQGNLPGSGFGNQGPGNSHSGMAAANGIQMFGGGTGSQMSGSTNSHLNGLNPGNGIPPGFFSIPAGKTLRLPYTSICLNHGLKEPTSRTTVHLLPVEEFTTDPVLQDLIQKVGSGEQSQRTLQAAVWHVANGLSWEQLARKGNGPIPVRGDHYFSRAQMDAARGLVAELRAIHPAAEQVADRTMQRLPADVLHSHRTLRK